MTADEMNPTLREALNMLLNLHTGQSSGGNLIVREDIGHPDTDQEVRRRDHNAWRVVAPAAASKSNLAPGEPSSPSEYRADPDCQHSCRSDDLCMRRCRSGHLPYGCGSRRSDFQYSRCPGMFPDPCSTLFNRHLSVRRNFLRHYDLLCGRMVRSSRCAASAPLNAHKMSIHEPRALSL